jgi:hypothetical protein
MRPGIQATTAMSITISLPAETEEKLRRRAAECGQTVDGYLRQLVERDVNGSAGPAPGSSPEASASPGSLPSDEAPGRKPEQPQQVQERFRQLAKQWKQETEHLSSTARMIRHPAYQEIIRMGEPAVPLLLAELRRDPDFWFAALRTITGDDPVPAASTGKVREMARAWIEWGRAKGLIK